MTARRSCWELRRSSTLRSPWSEPKPKLGEPFLRLANISASISAFQLQLLAKMMEKKSIKPNAKRPRKINDKWRVLNCAPVLRLGISLYFFLTFIFFQLFSEIFKYSFWGAFQPVYFFISKRYFRTYRGHRRYLCLSVCWIVILFLFVLQTIILNLKHIF